MKRKLLFIILLITGIAVWYAYTEYNRTSTKLNDTKAAITIEALALLAQFEKDSAAASKQYNGKVIAVSGTIKKVEADGNPVVLFLGDAAQMSSVQCSMDSANAAQYTLLKNGAVATIKGQVSGFRTDPLFGTDIILNRCVVAAIP